jgi:hypothetical protein
MGKFENVQMEKSADVLVRKCTDLEFKTINSNMNQIGALNFLEPLKLPQP